MPKDILDEIFIEKKEEVVQKKRDLPVSALQERLSRRKPPLDFASALKGDSLRFLSRSRGVERYAYFNPAKGKPHSLLKEDGSLSRMGELYRDA